MPPVEPRTDEPEELEERRGALERRIGLLDAKSVVISALVGGAAMFLFELTVVPLMTGRSAWTRARMLAAMILGPDTLVSPAPMGSAIVAALIVHFGASLLFALVLDVLVRRMRMLPAILVGALYGLVLYLLNFRILTSIVPWFVAARGGASILSHLVFGVVTAGVFDALYRRYARTHPEVLAA